MTEDEQLEVEDILKEAERIVNAERPGVPPFEMDDALKASLSSYLSQDEARPHVARFLGRVMQALQEAAGPDYKLDDSEALGVVRYIGALAFIYSYDVLLKRAGISHEKIEEELFDLTATWLQGAFNLGYSWRATLEKEGNV